MECKVGLILRESSPRKLSTQWKYFSTCNHAGSTCTCDQHISIVFNSINDTLGFGLQIK